MNGKKKKLLFILLFVISLLIINQLSKRTTRHINYSNANIPDLTPNPTSLPTAIPTPTHEPKWLLQKKSPYSSVQTIFEFNRNGLNYIKRWKDYLIYSYYIGSNDNVGKNDKSLNIYRYNLTTEKGDILFHKVSKELAVESFQLIENTIFFHLGGYQQEGESYWIDLNYNFTIHKLAQEGTVEKIRNHYFLIKEEGDECWSRADFSLLNIKTKIITPIAKTQSGCLEGDEYLGINYQDQMLLAHHERDSMYLIPQGKYTNIIGISLSEPWQKNYLLNTVTMPNSIVAMKYSDEENKLLLLGDALYIYSFDTDELQKIVDLPTGWKNQDDRINITGWKRNIICLEKAKIGNTSPTGLWINRETKATSNNLASCPNEPKQEEKSDPQNIDELFKSLHLPPEYILIKTNQI